MAQFIIAYHGGREYGSPEEAADGMKRWMGWVAAQGEALVVPGQPLGASWTVTADGAREGYDNPLTGYSVIEAASLAAALEVARACPFVEIGELEVCQLLSMGPKG